MAGEGFDRRSFIKACAGVGAAGAAAAAGFGMLRPISDVDVNIVPISYPGVKVLKGSPAPYGMPLIPLEIEDGVLKGRPDAAEDQLKWYKYCSHERAPGTFPEGAISGFTPTNEIKYFVTEEKIEKGLDVWYEDLIGNPIRADDFPKEEPNESFDSFTGVGAPFEWRSEGVPAESKITGIIVKFPKEELSFDSRVPAPQAEEMDAWFPEVPGEPENVFLGCCSFCTHFCCVPGFHEAELALSSGYGGTIFCTCHLSRYDPFTIQNYNRTIFTFPNGAGGDEGGGGGGGGGH